jgi:N-acetylglucosamine-6-phosphate deacetylase
MAPAALCGARIQVGDRLLEGMAVVVEDGRISTVVPAADLPRGISRHELAGGTLSAGFIDTQVNGGGGALFNEAPDVETLRVIGSAHRRFGTTGFLPTVISDDAAVVDRAMRAVEHAIADGVPGVLGIHIEGPLLAPTRHGIHDKRFLRGADREMLDLIRSLKVGRTLVTVAPEVAGTDVIAELVASGVVVSAGHTEASYEEMRAGFAAGVSGVTHLFNAMSPLTNRAPGAVGAALENPDAWCGLIVDGIHVHPATLTLALRSRPLDRFMLVTDAMPPVGTDATRFVLQGREIRVVEGRCVDESGTLAGSILTMAQAVRNAVELLGLPLATALRLASASPAAFLGLSAARGAISAGMTADLVWLDEDLKVAGIWSGKDGFEEGEP